jgi:phosphoribosylformylglycinamidine synthase
MPRIGVISFPGTCDDRDALRAVELAGGEGVPLWHADAELEGCTGVIVPGGFSYGDYLRAGAIARFAPMMGEVAAFAAAGGPVLGICNGFQVLCEAGLLPGVLRPNHHGRFVCRDVDLVVQHAGQIALRYAENPNGALADVACVTSEAGNVCGLMPHPEHAMDELLGPIGGRPLLAGLVALAKAHRTAVAATA